MTVTSLLDLDRDGACLAPALAKDLLVPLRQALGRVPSAQAGARLTGMAGLSVLLGQQQAIGAHIAAIMGRAVKPVRAILFDKSDAVNWSLGWHQDRTIAVARRCDLPGFGPWSMKQGLCHVEPPFAFIAAMVTIRIHLDPVDAKNAPLLIAPGTHHLGRIPVEDVERVARNHLEYACLADAGDVWVYRTPILHASARAASGRRRRVLQVDYSAQDLPAGLEWLGI